MWLHYPSTNGTLLNSRYLLFDVENVVAASGDHEMLIEGCLRRPVQPLAHSGGLFWLDFFFLLRLFL